MTIDSLGELYGDRYEANIKRALEAINERILKIIDNIEAGGTDRESDEFLAQLEAQRAELEGYITQQYNEAHQDAIAGSYEKGLALADSGALAAAPFSTVSAETFKAIARNQVVWFEVANAQAATDVMDSLMSWAYSGDRDKLAILKQMNEEKLARYGKTIVNNHVTVFAQTAVNTKAVQVGIKRFRYVGPLPQRPFCQSLFATQGQRGFTAQEISAMDNGQGGSVFMTRGGYGCRHSWQPIADSLDETIKPKSMDELEAKLKDRGVFYSDKPVVYIRDTNGQIINKMNRNVTEDDKGYFYKRFDGTRQQVQKSGSDFIFQAKQ